MYPRKIKYFPYLKKTLKSLTMIIHKTLKIRVQWSVNKPGYPRPMFPLTFDACIKNIKYWKKGNNICKPLCKWTFQQN